MAVTQAPARRRAAPLVATGVIAVGAAGATVLVIVPPTEANSLYPACPFKTLTGLDCPFCGGLRSTHELLTGNVAASADQNLLVPALALAGLVAVMMILWRRRRQLPAWDLDRVLARVAPVVLVVAGVFWIARNLPGVPYLGSGIG